MDTQPSPPASATTSPAREGAEPSNAAHAFDFGPYRGQSIAFVAVADPDYLLDLVREGIGSDALRAEAARALALRARLVTPDALAVHDARLAPPARNQSARDDTAPAATDAAFASASAPASASIALRPLLAPLAPLAARPWRLALVVGALVGAGLVLDAHRAEREGLGIAGSAGMAGHVAGGSAASSAPLAPASGAAHPEADRASGAHDPSRSPSASASTSATATAVAQAAADATSAADAPPPPCGARIEGAIPAESAGDYLDTFQAVEFEVVQAKDTGRVTFLNSRIPYAGAFYVAIFPDDYGAFPEPPAVYLAGRCIVVQGTIETYRGAPQIVLRHPDDLRILPEMPAPEPDPAAAPATAPTAPTAPSSGRARPRGVR